MELPPPHVFACVVDEIVISPSGRGHSIERKTERGLSSASLRKGVLELETTDLLDDAEPSARRWLEETSASDPGRHPFAIRSLERRVWILTDAGEQRYAEHLLVVPGLGVVTSPMPPPRAREGQILDPTLPLLFAQGTAAILMHEIAGHRAESASESLALPSWLSVFDAPERAFDDAGLATRETNLSGSSATTFRRWRAIDAPLQRMSHVIVRASEDAPNTAVDECVLIRAISAGHWNESSREVSLAISDAVLVRDGIETTLRVPTRLVLHEDAILRRIVGAGRRVIDAPGSICGSHGSDLPVRSSACELLLGGDDG